MFRKLFIGLFSLSVFLTGCEPPPVVIAPETNVLPLFQNQEIVSSLENQLSSPRVLNALSTFPDEVRTIFRFGRVNNRLYRGGLPTDEEIAGLRKFKIKSVISFRGLGDPTEDAQVAMEKALVEKSGMKFYNIRVPFDTPVPDNTIKAFFATVNNPQNQPLFVHCKGGRDRTGTMIAFYRIKFDSYNPSFAIEEMKEYTFVPENYPVFTQQILTFNPRKY